MSLRRFLAIFVLLALALAPFGRMGAAQAQASPHHATASATAAHCTGQPASGNEQSDRASIDCMIACAAMMSPASSELGAPRHHRLEVSAATPPDQLGVLSQAEPPPPRLA